MIKRVVIGGCRDYNNYNIFKIHVDHLLQNIRNEFSIVIVSGGASGVDAMAERYAKENSLPFELFEADWKRYGKSAGPKRNEQMVQVADYVIAFWDFHSRGTKSLIEFTNQCNKPLRIKDIRKF